MRNLALSSWLLIGALVAPARADRKDIVKPSESTGSPAAARDAVFLEASEVAADVRAYSPAIERCYLDRLGDVRRAGRLDLRFVIGRDGHVVSLGATAPGLPSRTVQRVSSCIRDAIDGLQFPARRSSPTASVPCY